MKQKVSFFSKEFRISVFGAGWWFYVLLTALGLLVLTVIGNKMPDAKDRLRLILIMSIIELIVLRLYKFSLKGIRSNYNYFNELPCYLCNQSTLLCIIAALTNDQHLMAFCIIIGTFGAILAFVMPDSYNKDQLFYSKQAVGFYGYHGLLIATCLSFYALKVYIPNLKDAFWNMFLIFLLATVAHVVNYVLRRTGLNPEANYVFTYDPDNVILKKFYSLIPIKLLYLLPIMPIFGLISFVILLIM
ncbi:MAG: YwaF family protein [Erysipelotrichaceae bacterium]|nr:YwaF family protein [Erysipelotrichaceae bacterium]